MADANDIIDTEARPALATDVADVRDMIDGAEMWRRHDEGGGEIEELRYGGFPLSCHLLPYFRS